jgi:hypothetical protein
MWNHLRTAEKPYNDQDVVSFVTHSSLSKLQLSHTQFLCELASTYCTLSRQSTQSSSSNIPTPLYIAGVKQADLGYLKADLPRVSRQASLHNHTISGFNGDSLKRAVETTTSQNPT